MSFTHTATGVRTGMASKVAAGIGSSGKLKILATGGGALCVITLPTGGYSPAAGAVDLTAAATSLSGSVTTAGTANKFTITTSADAVVLTGAAGSVTVTGGAGDIKLSSVVLATGETITITSLTYTAPV